MAVFLSLALVLGGVRSVLKNFPAETGILGGPVIVNSAEASGMGGNLALLTDGNAPIYGASVMSGNSDGDTSNLYPDPGVGGAVGDTGVPVGPSFARMEPITYTVEAGDNLSRVASYFNISIDTLVSANPEVKSGFLRVGDKLKILPTSGVVYVTKPEDTLESVSAYFNIPEDKILEFNRSVNFSSLGAGISLVIPGGHSFNLASLREGELPDLNDYFIEPAQGYDWGILHHYNAVDIANICGTPVSASADGLVIPDENFGSGTDGWNGGYGRFVLIEHPFGTNVRTRYAHLGKVLVGIGDYVKQGQEIGLMGDTGDATGCHLHFEVYGAENPFAK